MFRAASTLLLGATALAAAFVATPAQAQTTPACKTITSVPVTLGTQGVYCLAKDLTTNIAAGAAIQLTANNITIDCRGHSLVGTAPLPTNRSGGINGTGLANITIRNCSLRGFSSAVILPTGTGGHLVENNSIAGNGRRGIYAEGEGTVVRGNRVVDTGGTDATAYITALEVYADGAVVEDNYVAGVSTRSGGTSRGISVAGVRNTVARNQILDLDSGNVGGVSGLSVFVNGPGQSVILENTVVVRGTHPGYREGLYTSDNLTTTCRGNVFVGFPDLVANLWTICHDAGHNTAQ